MNIVRYSIIIATIAACGGGKPATSSGPTSHANADTPRPADGKCDFVNYYHDESKSSKACESDCDCDGMRSCNAGACTGTARPETLTAATCNSKDYIYNEAWTSTGANSCTGDCQCDGMRTCVSGQCTGTAR